MNQPSLLSEVPKTITIRLETQAGEWVCDSEIPDARTGDLPQVVFYADRAYLATPLMNRRHVDGTVAVYIYRAVKAVHIIAARGAAP